MSSLEQTDEASSRIMHRDVRCTHCNLQYNDNDRTPFLLVCGHAVCERCYGKSSYCICDICNEKTTLGSGEERFKHLYLYGLVHDACPKWSGRGSHTYARKPMDNVLLKSSIKKPLVKNPCDECLQAKATVQCRQCWIAVCLSCFNKIHAPMAIRKHKPEALIIPAAAFSCLVPECLAHSQNLATIMCISCSEGNTETYICTTCQQSEKHDGHKFLDIASPAPHLKEFKSAVSEMKAGIRLLQERVELCHTLRQKALQYREHEFSRVQTFMQRLHGILQLKEDSILSKLYNSSNHLQDDLLKEQDELEKEIHSCEAVLRYGELLMEGEVPSMNFSKFLKEVGQFRSSIGKSNFQHCSGFYKCKLNKDLEYALSDCIKMEDVNYTIQSLGDILSGFTKVARGPAVDAVVIKEEKSLVLGTEKEVSSKNFKNDRDLDSTKKNISEMDILIPESFAKIVADRKADVSLSLPIPKSSKISTLNLIHDVKSIDNISIDLELRQMCSNENGTDLLSDITADHRSIPIHPVEEEEEVIKGHPSREGKTEILVNLEPDVAAVTAVCNFQKVHVKEENYKLVLDAVDDQEISLINNAWITSGARPKVTKVLDGLPDISPSAALSLAYPPVRTLSGSNVHSSASCALNSTQDKVTPLLMEEHVRVTFVESPSLFYVQRSLDYNCIESLGHQLNRIARVETRIVEVVPFVGKVYICRFSADGQWYRAVVLSVMPDSQEVVVKYVDYGNKETTSTSRLRECPPAYHLETLPPFSLACSLWEVIPARGDHWDSEATKTFSDLVEETSLQLYIIGSESVQDVNKCLVDLRRPGRTAGIVNDLPLSIREVLIFLEYAVYVNDSPQDQYKEMTPMRSYYRPVLPFGKYDTEVLVSHVKSPNEFYLQLKSSSDCLTSLMKELQSHYNSSFMTRNLDWQIFAPKIGMLCVAKYTGDEKWYRAVIVDLPGYRKVDVFYVDFGNKERLWYKQVKKIADRFTLLSMQAVPCGLLGIEPYSESWDPDIADLMTSIFDSQKILAMFHSYEDERAIVSLSVQSGADEMDFYDKLIKMGLAKNAFIRHEKSCSKELTFQMRTQMEVNDNRKRPEILAEVKKVKRYAQRKKEEVTCLSITSPSCIHLRPTSMLTEFKKLQDKLIQKMQNRTSFAACPKIGDICIVKCKPSSFARVKILEDVNQETLVHFIDCGTIQTVEQTDLFELPEDMTETLPLSLSVSLADITPPGGQRLWPGVTKDRLEELLSVEEKLYMKPQGEVQQHPDYGIEVIPAYIELAKEKLGGPFEANSVAFISVNDLLIQEGLALPSILRGHSPIPSFPYSVEDMMAEISNVSSEKELTGQDLNIADASKVCDQSTSSYEDVNKTICEWVPCDLPKSTVFAAYPSYVDEYGTIYLQPLKNIRTLQMMSEGFSMMVVNSLPSDEDLCWTIGDPVIARFFLDQKWYRATVLRLLEKGKVLVQFVDYGNTDVVMLSDLRRNIVYDQVPVQCYKGILHRTEPRNLHGYWETEILDFLHKTIVEKECLVTVMEKPCAGEPLQVHLLLKEHSLDVISLLVDKLKICRRVKSKLNTTEDSCDVVIEGETSPIDFPLVCLPSLSLPGNPSEMFRVKVTAIKDPASVYISPVFPNGSSEFECALQSSVTAYKSFYSSVNSDPSPYASVKDPQIGRIYLGMFSTQDWYRVQVIAKTSTQVTVMFVDTGNLEDISIKNLRECPDAGLNIPAMAVGVKLHKVIPPGGNGSMWSEEAMKAMINCLMNTNDNCFWASVVGMESCPQIELFFEDNRKLAYAGVIASGLVDIKTDNTDKY
ncbi:RING finger protein 17-like [Palaemon carinicauda]|uniref:RING finger protein 17-like n=1 Tax=Palaemon carinicauda TaxID=392227 RepID=UPI0035B5E7D8